MGCPPVFWVNITAGRTCPWVVLLKGCNTVEDVRAGHRLLPLRWVGTVIDPRLGVMELRVTVVDTAWLPETRTSQSSVWITPYQWQHLCRQQPAESSTPNYRDLGPSYGHA